MRASQAEHGIAMERFYELEGLTRQGYFQAMARKRQEMEMIVQIEMKVKAYRRDKDRRAGSRSLYYNLDIKSWWNIGVNKFERLMSNHGLVLAPYKTRLITTQSCARSRDYDDLAKGMLIDGINQLVVGDLTYIQFPFQVNYLFLLTDVYSARVVGYELGDRMRAIEAHRALMQWIMLRGEVNINSCLHHTDGGSQYFSNLYLSVLKKNQIQISVADNCLDNGFAEQRNGLLKHHFIPIMADLKPERLKKKMGEILYFYNQERKQERLGWLSPAEFEQKWTNSTNAPKMKLYDREAKHRTIRLEGF